MNRYGRGPTIGGPSKATASTTCQKCLKKGHYSYECKTVIQERPYVSRPSRTQQLLNPKLAPKLTSDVPQDLLRKKGVADEQLARLEQERGRKRDRQSEDPEIRGASKRMRSTSTTSSVSVSTISTSISRSPSPRPSVRNSTADKAYSANRSHSPPTRVTGHRRRPSASTSRSPPPRQHLRDSERKRRRDSYSSVDSYTSEDGRSNTWNSRERPRSRSTQGKSRQVSPPARGRRADSRSPHRGRRRLSNDRRRLTDREKPHFSNDGPPPRNELKENRDPPRERSLSPFSKRLALTQAMNMGR
ncbi:hypothetical protein M430DRAFT_38122 [Amorphotheca resinae ATCC 22711]|uniref:Zinc knuckle-domain-containing protein n=1 Tax=Amorphotheca resinae ATCC 22711 TaxID=857342 RepID=A0A2T3BD56_AMORE|nr:hypothetical protein M430DRAFT_38122 [Amorphotheca resinae ATCC 22711]PSS27340.1 hypothetical protein M430DRAFT_38122 [Amorphotheca resinae ATCC 22711]